MPFANAGILIATASGSEVEFTNGALRRPWPGGRQAAHEFGHDQRIYKTNPIRLVIGPIQL
jgi:hypothetical protein